jgi:superfamily II DNA/RNA helicase
MMERVENFLRQHNYRIPTPIQQLLIPRLLAAKDRESDEKSSQSSLFAGAETGSGKTLAYLLPLMTRLKLDELDNENEGQPGEPDQKKRGSSKLLVLVPTQELREQTTAVAKSLCHHLKLRVADDKSPVDSVLQSCDVLVQTPQEHILSRFDIGCKGAVYLVVDEGDTLLGGRDDFAGRTVRIVRGLDPRSLVVVSATMPDPLRKRLSQSFPVTSC